MRTLITAGVDGMFTNFPDRLDGCSASAGCSRYSGGRAGGEGVGRLPQGGSQARPGSLK